MRSKEALSMIFLLLVFAGCAAMRQESLPATATIDEREVFNLMVAFVDKGWVKNDETAIPEYFTEDAVITLSRQNLILNRNEYQQMSAARGVDNKKKGITLQPNIKPPQVNGNVSKIIVEFLLFNIPNRPEPIYNIRYFTLEKRDGNWKITRLTDIKT
jgi:hypothetical protein